MSSAARLVVLGLLCGALFGCGDGASPAGGDGSEAADAPASDGPAPTPVLRGDDPRPNVVLILADDMGWADVGCYGARNVETPHIDRLAAEGTRFTQFYSSSPVCLPTRLALLTGRYPNRDGVDGNVTVPGNTKALAALDQLMPKQLQAVGYATGLMGKWHLGSGRKAGPIHRGFDVFRGYLGGYLDYTGHTSPFNQLDWWHGDARTDEPGYATHLISNHAVEFIEQHRARPFYLVVSHAAPHTPYQGPGDPPVAVRNGRVVRADMRSDVAVAYREMITELDHGVGDVLAALERHDLVEHTLVAFMSDNGPRKVGETGVLHGTKGSVWEGGIRVPAIVRWPGRIDAGSVVEQVGTTLDWVPTVLELAQTSMAPSRPVDGDSLVAVLTEGEALGERTHFWIYRAAKDELRAAVRRGKWKVVFGMNRPLLFDLSIDAAERHDLSAAHPELTAELTEAILTWAKTATDARDLPFQIRSL